MLIVLEMLFGRYELNNAQSHPTCPLLLLGELKVKNWIPLAISNGHASPNQRGGCGWEEGILGNLL